MKHLSTLSIAIATFNEEKFIASCLNSVSGWVDEIVVVDGKSSDETVAIIKNYPHTKVISTENKPMFHLNKQMAIDGCKSDWILQLDADEVISHPLKAEILQILAKKPTEIPENGFWVNRSNFFLGAFLKKGGQYPDPTLRLYKRGLGHLPCKSVHEQAEVLPPLGHLNHDLLHYADTSFGRYIERNNRYTSLIADELFSHHLSCNFITFLQYFYLKPIAWFFSTFFRHRGYVDGFPGFVFSLFSALRFPIAYIKVYEKYQNS